MASRDLRRNFRIPFSGAVEVSWDDHGMPGFARGRCVNLSEDGMRIELPTAVPVQSMVTIRVPEIGLVGSAVVRHSRRSGIRFSVGIELSQHLRRMVLKALESPRFGVLA
jgi:hypothetical protein